MGRLQHQHRSRSATSFARSSETTGADLDARSLGYAAAAASTEAVECPFGHVDGLSRAELREAAYEVFFMSCRAASGGSGRGLNYYPAGGGGEGGGDGSPTIGAGPRGGTGMNVVSSRVKRALGLKARRSSQPTTLRSSMGSSSSAPGSPGRVRAARDQAPGSPGKPRRPMTSAEIMRQQMRVTDQSDARLRKTLMRTLVGQVGKKADTIVLPLEVLRQLKVADFADSGEHHQWQRRQLKLLEAGLILHPSLPLDRLNGPVLRFREIMQAADARAIDTGKASDTMRALCDAVLALAWRSAPGTGPPGEACHWADGYPLNVLLYVSLLQAIFDLKEETVVLDEVDELLELMKRTWTTLGIHKMLHNVCFAWVLFQHYVATGQIEPDLARAALTMLTDVAADAKQENRDPVYALVLSSALGAMHDWSEKRLLDYHERYGKGMTGAGNGAMEDALSLALSTSKIIAESVPGMDIITLENSEHQDGGVGSFSGDRVDYYVRCSMRSAFTKMLENELGQGNGTIIQRDDDDPSEILARLAKDTEQLALSERDNFSHVLRRWHPFPGATAVATLHSCYGVVLKQYLADATCLSNEVAHVLHAAGRLEKALVQIMVEDVADCDDGGRSIVREVVPYDVESLVVRFLKTWIEERLRAAKECLLTARDTESWMPKSKGEPYARSAVELMKLAKSAVDEFFGIPVTARDRMVRELADGLGVIFHEYISFLASCGTKQSYIPPLPQLTRCNQDSRIIRLWRRAATPCRASGASPRGGVYHGQSASFSGGNNPRPSTSRGTQRLYIRLNTLHYLLSHIHALDKSLSFFSSHGRYTSPTSSAANRPLATATSNHFDRARAAAQSGIVLVAEVAAYRLIFLDSHHSFYGGLYVGGVADARIRPALRTLKQNLSFLVSVLVDRAQPVAVREVMKASFQAFLLVLLAGGSERSFTAEEHALVEEDFRGLKRAFCTRGEGLVAEDVVEAEARVAECVVELMGETTERLVDEFGIAAYETAGAVSDKQAMPMPMPMPPTTRRWSRRDPNTILRVLCHRDDEVASHFLKRTFQLPKRRMKAEGIDFACPCPGFEKLIYLCIPPTKLGTPSSPSGRYSIAIDRFILQNSTDVLPSEDYTSLEMQEYNNIQITETKLTWPNLVLVLINPPLVITGSAPLALQFQYAPTVPRMGMSSGLGLGDLDLLGDELADDILMSSTGPEDGPVLPADRRVGADRVALGRPRGTEPRGEAGVHGRLLLARSAGGVAVVRDRRPLLLLPGRRRGLDEETHPVLLPLRGGVLLVRGRLGSAWLVFLPLGVDLYPAMSAPNRDSTMQQLVPIAPPPKASGSESGKELVVVDPAGKGSGGVKLREDEEDLEVKLRRIMENVPVRVSNTSGSSAGSGSGDFHQYRQMRRREQDRLARMDADYQRRKEIAEFELRREERLKAAEERTAKKRLKRQKKKQRKKEKRTKTGNGGEEPNRGESSDDDEADPLSYIWPTVRSGLKGKRGDCRTYNPIDPGRPPSWRPRRPLSLCRRHSPPGCCLACACACAASLLAFASSSLRPLVPVATTRFSRSRSKMNRKTRGENDSERITSDGTAARTRPMSIQDIMLQREKKAASEAKKTKAGFQGNDKGTSTHLEQGREHKIRKDPKDAPVEGSKKEKSRDTTLEGSKKENLRRVRRSPQKEDMKYAPKEVSKKDKSKDKPKDGAKMDDLKDTPKFAGKEGPRDATKNGSKVERPSVRDSDHLVRKDKGIHHSQKLSAGMSGRADESKDRNLDEVRERNGDAIRSEYQKESGKRWNAKTVDDDEAEYRSEKLQNEMKRKGRNFDNEKISEVDWPMLKKQGSARFQDYKRSDRNDARNEYVKPYHGEPRLKRRRSRSRDHDRGRHVRSISPPLREQRHNYRGHEFDNYPPYHSMEKSRRKYSEVDKQGRSGGSHQRYESRLGGYSPRKKRTALQAEPAATKTPTSVIQSPEKKSATWDQPPVKATTLQPTGGQMAPSTPFNFSALKDPSTAVETMFAGNSLTADSVQLTQATRPLRRLHIENLPDSATEDKLIDCLNDFLSSTGIKHSQRSKPCLSCTINKEKRQAFVEFLTPEDATAALSFDGRSLNDSALRIQRPKEYVETLCQYYVTAATSRIHWLITVVADRQSPYDAQFMETLGRHLDILYSMVQNVTPKKHAEETALISDIVADSPHKIFIAGIGRVISSEMLMEIVGAFGPLAAYRFLFNDELGGHCAFLEYADRSITSKACAGLSGMKLGGCILTAVHVFPNPPVEATSEGPPFYGIPENAKSLLEEPTKVLQLKDLFDREEYMLLSKSELEETLEDVRAECARFGAVKSVNVVGYFAGSDNTAEANMVELEDRPVKTEHTEFGDSENIAKGGSEFTVLNQSIDGLNRSDAVEAKDVDLIPDSRDQKDKHLPLNAALCESETPVADEHTDLDDTHKRAALTTSQHAETDCTEAAVDESKHTETTVEATTTTMDNDVVEMRHQDPRTSETCSPAGDKAEKPGRDSEQSAGIGIEYRAEKIPVFETSDPVFVFEPGSVLVEFTREEAACIAAHSLHGRRFGNRTVYAGYAPHDLYLLKYPRVSYNLGDPQKHWMSSERFCWGIFFKKSSSLETFSSFNRCAVTFIFIECNASVRKHLTAGKGFLQSCRRTIAVDIKL
ncbi:LOW QUALITY PROTEIN: hypothetical protein U9M48_006065, partial [Paspalum notatum var. saurae]